MLRRRLTFSNVTAFVALFVALSAGSYAAISLPANSVGSKQLKSNAVTSRKLASNAVSSSKIAANAVTGTQIAANAVSGPKIAANSVDGFKVADGTLTGADINVATLPKVPSAGVADSAGSASISRVKIVSATASSRPNGGSAPIDAATAPCDAGLAVVGGGASVSDQANQIVNDSFPSGNATWTAHVVNFGAASPGFTVYAICAPAASTQ
jgi:hypothetical protein